MKSPIKFAGVLVSIHYKTYQKSSEVFKEDFKVIEIHLDPQVFPVIFKPKYVFFYKPYQNVFECILQKSAYMSVSKDDRIFFDITIK